MPLQHGQILNNRYRIVKLLGQGGFGAVYRAWDINFNMPCAVKENFDTSQEAQRQFTREAKILRTLRHPNLPQVIDQFILPDQGQYLVMDFIEGQDLQAMINEKQGPLPEGQVLPWIAQICDALSLLHSQTPPIIHRDIKPANIKITPQGQAILVDFGIAKIYDAKQRTTSGARAVTPGFSPPEQYGIGTTDVRSDIYSLGATLYSILTGVFPMESIQRSMGEPLLPPHLFNPGISKQSEAAVLKAMDLQPTLRYTTIDEFKKALQAPAAPESLIQPQPAATQRAAMLATEALAVQGQPVPISAQSIPAAAGQPATAARPKSTRFALLAGLLVVILLAAAVFGRQLLPASGDDSASVANTQSAETQRALVALLQTETQVPEEQPTLAPTATPEPLPSSTPEPEPTETLVPTETPVPAGPVIGGADKIAFIKDGEIWAANLDGSELIQLTTGGVSKKYLRWRPDGLGLYYIANKCVQSVSLAGGESDVIACFNFVDDLGSFDISPDGTRVAITLDNDLYLIPANFDGLSEVKKRSDVAALADCPAFAPYTRNRVRYLRWSKDGQTVAANVIGNIDGIRWDIIQIFAVDRCIPNPRVQDNFPPPRFEVDGYKKNPYIENFSWDGFYLFVFQNWVRNDGFGELYVYNQERYKATVLKPVNNICCYRDPQWSPDGRYLLFAFQNYLEGSKSVTRLYYVPYSDISPGATFTPLPLPEITDPKEKPLPVLRPAVGP